MAWKDLNYKTITRYYLYGKDENDNANIAPKS